MEYSSGQYSAVLTMTCVAPCSSPIMDSKPWDPNMIPYTAPSTGWIKGKRVKKGLQGRGIRSGGNG